MGNFGVLVSSQLDRTSECSLGRFHPLVINFGIFPSPSSLTPYFSPVFKFALVMSAAGAQSRKFNSSSPFHPSSSPYYPFFHTHSLLFDALQLVNAESELGRLPIRGPTRAATHSTCTPARSDSRSSTSASLPRYLHHPSSDFLHVH